jgi:hypothetical protein
LSGETEVLGENPPQRHFVHHKSNLTRPGIEPEGLDCPLKYTEQTDRAFHARYKEHIQTEIIIAIQEIQTTY